jgi:hypothetical protein
MRWRREPEIPGVSVISLLFFMFLRRQPVFFGWRFLAVNEEYTWFLEYISSLKA